MTTISRTPTMLVRTFALSATLFLVAFSVSGQEEDKLPPLFNNKLPRLSINGTIGACYYFQPHDSIYFYCSNPEARKTLLRVIQHIEESEAKYYCLSYFILGIIGEDDDAYYLHDKICTELLEAEQDPMHFKIASDCISALGMMAERGSPGARKILEKFATWKELEEIPFLKKLRREQFIPYAGFVQHSVLKALRYESKEKLEEHFQSFEMTLNKKELEQWAPLGAQARKQYFEYIEHGRERTRARLSKPLSDETKFEIETSLANIPDDVAKFLEIPQAEIDIAKKKFDAHVQEQIRLQKEKEQKK